MKPRRVTIRDIANDLGIHYTTVSRALKGDIRISAETCRRVQKVAEELGYKPDPLLSALMVYRSQHQARSFHGTLAWMTNYPTPNGWRGYERSAYFLGAQRRAAEMGFKIEEFWLNDSKIKVRDAPGILQARNIRGLFFIPQPRSRAHIRFQWDLFALITFGHTLTWPALHSVSTDHFRCFAQIMRQLKKLGYRRPGYACWARVHESTDRAWAGAFSTFQTLPATKQVPLFISREWEFRKFKDWFLKHRPDVVISNDETVRQWIQELGLRIPEDIGFALGAKHSESSVRCSGMNENNELVGEIAAARLIEMVNQGAYGVPATPVSTLVEGSWMEGTTLRTKTLPGAI